jgi:alpha-D-ribose 1-methylphosphonate 5-triphosphate synthase subunit PhnG
MTPRQEWMSLLAGAPREEIEAAWATLSPPPAYRLLRGPENGLVMTRGRIGGGGAAFNLGEISATRCVVALAAGGPPGFAYLAGRDRRRAELAAAFDAMLQSPRAAEAQRAMAPLRERREARHRREAAEIAPTKVEFYTLVRE